jgi:hypothetical protein
VHCYAAASTTVIEARAMDSTSLGVVGCHSHIQRSEMLRFGARGFVLIPTYQINLDSG